MIEQITITDSPADLASFLNSITENVQIHLSILRFLVYRYSICKAFLKLLHFRCAA